jgi:nitric oxide reductase subunit B
MLSLTFWAINVGLALMVLLSVLPIGLLQVSVSVERGMWYAASPKFLQTDSMQTLRWLRIIGDSLFAFGGLCFGWFVVRLKTDWLLSTLESELPSTKVTETAAPEPVSVRAGH